MIIDLFNYISSDEYCYAQSKKYIKNLKIETEEYANWLSKMNNQLDVSKLNAKELSENIDILMFRLKDIPYKYMEKDISYKYMEKDYLLYLRNNVIIPYFVKSYKIREGPYIESKYCNYFGPFITLNIERLYLRSDNGNIKIDEENHFNLIINIINTFDKNTFDIYNLIGYFSNLSSNTDMENIRNIEYFSLAIMLEIAYIYIFYNHEKYDMNKFTKYFFIFQYNEVFILYLRFVLIYVLLYHDTVDIFKKKVEYLIKKYYKIINIDMNYIKKLI